MCSTFRLSLFPSQEPEESFRERQSHHTKASWIFASLQVEDLPFNQEYPPWTILCEKYPSITILHRRMGWRSVSEPSLPNIAIQLCRKYNRMICYRITEG